MKKVRGPLICVILINLQLGLSYSWSVFSQVLIEQEGWAYSEAVLPSTIASFAYALSMLVFGIFLERYGPKKTIQIGAVLMISGLLLAAVFMEPLGVVIGFGVFYGCAAGACFSATQAITLRWLAGSGSTVGITSAAFGISSVLLSVVANWLLKEIGIKLTIGGIGVVSGICILAIGTLLYLPALDAAPRTDQSRVISEEDLDCRGIVRKKAFYYLLGIYIFGTAAATVPNSHITMIVSLQGGLEDGYLYVSLISLFGFLGRLLGGSLSDHFGVRRVLLSAIVLNLGNMLLFESYTGPFSLAFGCMITGWFFGVLMVLIPVLVRTLFGSTYFARNFGLISGLGLVSGLLGSQLAGYLMDCYHTYLYSYWVCAAYMLVALASIRQLAKENI